MALNTGVSFLHENDRSKAKFTVLWCVCSFVNHSVKCTLFSLIADDEPDAVNADLQSLIISQERRVYSFNKQAVQPVALFVLAL